MVAMKSPGMRYVWADGVTDETARNCSDWAGNQRPGGSAHCAVSKPLLSGSDTRRNRQSGRDHCNGK
jgi:hypothetical protein